MISWHVTNTAIVSPFASQRLGAAIAIGYNAYFSVTMNNSGTCTSAFIDNDSAYLSNPMPINPS